MRFAVLGQGSAGRRHAAGLMALGHEVVGFDPAVADARGDFPMAASLDEALACRRTRPWSRARARCTRSRPRRCAAGRPAHVLVEKPLASSG